MPTSKKPRVNLSSISHDRHTNYTGDLPLKSLDDSRHLFTGFLSSPPTFKDACEDARITEKLIADSESLANEAMEGPEFKKYGLTIDEAQAITCYTVEMNEVERQKGVLPPYMILNNCLACNRTEENVTRTRKLLFLLLSGLRKLPRTKLPM